MIVIKETKKGIGTRIQKGTTYEEIMTGAISLLQHIIDHSDYNIEDLTKDLKGALKENERN